MSEERFTTGGDDTVERRPERKRSVGFGMRTAALAGIVVSASAVAIGLAGTIDDPTAVAHTTCCPPQASSTE